MFTPVTLKNFHPPPHQYVDPKIENSGCEGEGGHSGANMKLQVTLKLEFFTSFEFAKSRSPLGRNGKRRYLHWTFLYKSTKESAAYICLFGGYILFYFIFLWIFLAPFKWILNILLFSRVFLFNQFLTPYMIEIVKNVIPKYNITLWGITNFFLPFFCYFFLPKTCNLLFVKSIKIPSSLKS